MEHSTGAVNWQPVNRAKSAGELRRNALAHVAHGADGIAYFQWRAAKAGAEQWHSAMLPHAGTDSAIWQDVVQLGADLRALTEVQGSTGTASVAMVWDWNARWALELPSQPSEELRYLDQVRTWYEPLWRSGVAVDFVRPDADLSRYRLVLAPSLYLVDDAGAANLSAFASSGGTLAVGFHSGAVDENCHVRLGGYPGAFRETPGRADGRVVPTTTRESLALSSGGGTASLWSERVALAGAEAITAYAEGPLTGIPAVTRNAYGEGTAWYVATRPDPTTLAGLLDLHPPGGGSEAGAGDAGGGGGGAAARGRRGLSVPHRPCGAGRRGPGRRGRRGRTPHRQARVGRIGERAAGRGGGGPGAAPGRLTRRTARGLGTAGWREAGNGRVAQNGPGPPKPPNPPGPPGPPPNIPPCGP
ncbi:beta-galactosidase [Streptomyces sp. L7]